MNVTGILTGIKRHVPLTNEEAQFLSSAFNHTKLDQGELAEVSGEISQNMIFVNSGCLMTYFTHTTGTDQVIQFSTAGWWTGDLSSLTSGEPSSYTTRALTSCELLLLPKIRMDELLNRYPVFEKYFRIIFQNSLVTHQNRIIRHLHLRQMNVTKNSNYNIHNSNNLFHSNILPRTSELRLNFSVRSEGTEQRLNLNLVQDDLSFNLIWFKFFRQPAPYLCIID